MAKLRLNKFNSKKRMGFLDDLEETESGLYLSLPADKPGEVEAVMVLNSLVDDPDDLLRETFKYREDNEDRS